MLPHCRWAPLSLGNWPRTCSSSCLSTNLTHLCLAWWAEAEQECGSTLPQGDGEQPVSAPRTGTAPAFSATSADDLLKQAEERMETCLQGCRRSRGPGGLAGVGSVPVCLLASLLTCAPAWAWTPGSLPGTQTASLLCPQCAQPSGAAVSSPLDSAP